jgi:hypothetical protein
MRLTLIANLVLALSVAASPAAAADATEPAPVRTFLEQRGYSTFKLTKLPTGHETIEGTINGVAGTFVLDSGAGGTVLHKDRLEKFGIAGSSGAQEGAGAGGAVAIGSHAVTGFTLGGRPVPLTTIYSTDLDSVVGRLKAATGVEVDGVVGQDVLSGYSAVINIGTSELYLKLPPAAV